MFNMKPRKVYDIPETGDKGGTTYQTVNGEDLFDQKAKKIEKMPTFNPDESRRYKRDVIMKMQERTVETMIVVDRKMYEFHKTENVIEPYVLTIMNIVSKSLPSVLCNGNVYSRTSGSRRA